MAKAYKAVTRIRHGRATDQGAVVTEFAVGERVTGLSTDEMKSLWNAGALEMVEVEVTPPAPVVEEQKPAEEQASGGDA